MPNPASSSLTFLLLLSVTWALLISAKSPSQSPCKFTLYPKLCRSILSSFKSSPTNPNGYTQFSVKQCLKQAHKLSTLINRYQGSRLNQAAGGALEDCRQLSELSVGYLETISAELESELVSWDRVIRVQTLLSGIVTNQQTCYDGLVESGSDMASVLYAPMSNATQMYSVSLALVAHALGRTRRRSKRKGRSDDRFLMEVNRVTEPMSSIIKILQRLPQAASTKSRRGQRILSDLMDGGGTVNSTVIVSLNGDGNFTSIGDAIAFAPNNSRVEAGFFIIYVKEGYYYEYVTVPKNKANILLLGDGINRTVITGDRNWVDGWTTYNSATFAVTGDRFIAIDVTFKNTAGPQKHQAVAIRNNADISTFYRCSFEGYQDTLYAHSMTQFYRDCDIYGTVDFIFGNAASVFQNCNLYARKPLPNQKNVLTAQGRSDPNQNTGISIQNCTIQAASDFAMNLNSTSSYLGRPWKEYSRTVYMESYIGSLISPVGWLAWNGTLGLNTLYYGEFENYGPGANTSLRVQWPGFRKMDTSEAVNFTVDNFTMGDFWLPITSVPFSRGLLQK